MAEMAPYSRSVSEAATKLEASASPPRRRSNLVETRGAMGDDAIEAALKEISAQLRSNKKHLKKLRREVQNNKNMIEKCKKRMDAMTYNNMARMGNQGITDDEDELLPFRDCKNREIEGFPSSADGFQYLTEQECDRIAKKMDWPFYSWSTLQHKQRSLLQAVGYRWELDDL